MIDNLVFYHSIFKYFVIIIISIVATNSFFCWKNQKPYTKFHEILSRINIGIIHSQMLLGIILLTHSPKVQYSSVLPHNDETHYWSYTHPIIMFIAIILVTLALLLVRKKETDKQKHQLTYMLNLIAFICIMVGLVVPR